MNHSGSQVGSKDGKIFTVMPLAIAVAIKVTCEW